MSCLSYFESILSLHQIEKLKELKIKSVSHFLQEPPDNIANITKLHFREVCEIKQKLLDACRSKPQSGFQLYEEITNNYFIFPTGISEIDKLIGGLHSGSTYEICGLSGSGKTQICLGIAAHVSHTGKCVHFIDTKGDFSARRIFQLLTKKKNSKKDVIASLERIKVSKIYNLYQLINVLHWLKSILSYCHIPLIIIDCISTSYFLSISQSKTIGLGLLNHAASLMKFISSEYHTVVVMTNLATRSFLTSDKNRIQERVAQTTKPCLGNYWRQVCNIRINVKNEKNSIVSVSLDKNDFDVCIKDHYCINLHDI